MKNTQPNITQIHMTSKETHSYAKKKLIVIAIVKKNHLYLVLLKFKRSLCITKYHKKYEQWTNEKQKIENGETINKKFAILWKM